jgi:hypothetical protein
MPDSFLESEGSGEEFNLGLKSVAKKELRWRKQCHDRNLSARGQTFARLSF